MIILNNITKMNITFIYFFTLRLLKSKYRSSIFGIVLSNIFPLLAAIILSLIFSNIYNQSFQNFFPTISLAIIPWFFFLRTVNELSTSIIFNSQIIKRKIQNLYNISVCYLISNLFDTLINFIIFFIIIFIFQKNEFYVDYFLMFVTIITFVLFVYSIGIFCAILNVYFNDFKHLLNFSLQALFFLTPIIYQLKQIGENFEKIIKLNPLTQFIIMFQKVVVQDKAFLISEINLIFGITIVVLIISTLFLNLNKNKIQFYI